MSDRKEENAPLDAFFASAQQEHTRPLPPTLAARILHEADKIQSGDFTTPVTSGAMVAPPPFHWFSEVKAALGGWRGLSGLGVAMLTGVWIGLVNPNWLQDFSNTVMVTAESQGTDFSEANYLFETAFSAQLGFEIGI